MLKKSLLVLLLNYFYGFVYAQTMFNVALTSSATQYVLPLHNGVITYLVTNMTTKTRTITMLPILGVIQTSSDPGDCGATATLQPNASCILSLTTTYDIMTQFNLHVINVAPVVCKTNNPDSTIPDLHFCSKTCEPSKLIKADPA